MNRYLKNLLLALFSGILLAVSWPKNGISFLLFIAFIPLLFLENDYYIKKIKNSSIPVFLYSWLTFLTWNILTTYWIKNATVEGAVGANIANSLFMAITFTIFHTIRCKINSKNDIYILMFIWITFEYIHLNWDLDWTWLTLGNGLASSWKIIQWYEYTGVLGGSLWVLGLNILGFSIFKKIILKENGLNKSIIAFSVILLVPISVSIIRYYTYNENHEKPINVVMVQPNVDPYYEKFVEANFAKQNLDYINLAKQKTDNNTDFILGPETAIVDAIWLNNIEDEIVVDLFENFVYQYKKANLVIGINSFKLYENEGEKTSTSRKFSTDGDEYYDAFNTAILISKNQKIQYHNKSKLVIGVEKMPYPVILKFLESLIIDLGGTSGSLGFSEKASVLKTNNNITVAPIICYESIYGEYVTSYVSLGAQALFIITNDGWWGETPGYKQHNEYARLRAIETRRSIARCANTGTSCFLNQKGDMFDETKYNTEAVLSNKIYLNNDITFYVKFGDYIGRISALISVLLLLLYIVKLFKKEKIKNSNI